jgi:phenylpyruvate tautomerase PptA (4-oxalocrotonate tautomerase family)
VSILIFLTFCGVWWVFVGIGCKLVVIWFYILGSVCEDPPHPYLMGPIPHIPEIIGYFVYFYVFTLTFAFVLSIILNMGKAGRPVGSTNIKTLVTALSKAYKNDPSLMGLSDVEKGVPLDVYDHPKNFAKIRLERFPLRQRMLSMEIGDSFLCFSWSAAERARQMAHRYGIKVRIRRDIILKIPDVYRMWKVATDTAENDDTLGKEFRKSWGRKHSKKKAEKDVTSDLAEILGASSEAPVVIVREQNKEQVQPNKEQTEQLHPLETKTDELIPMELESTDCVI